MIRVVPARLSARWAARRPARERSRARETSDAPASVAGYTTFSAKSVASLTVLGGALTALGALGAWVRATQTVVEGFAPEEVEVVTGTADPLAFGWALAAIAVATAVSSMAWFAPTLLPKATVLVGSAGVIGLVAWHLDRLDERAAAMVAEAQASPQFLEYHAGFAWGAWLSLFGAIALALGLVVGGLRELDLRRGR